MLQTWPSCQRRVEHQSHQQQAAHREEPTIAKRRSVGIGPNEQQAGRERQQQRKVKVAHRPDSAELVKDGQNQQERQIKPSRWVDVVSAKELFHAATPCARRGEPARQGSAEPPLQTPSDRGRQQHTRAILVCNRSNGPCSQSSLMPHPVGATGQHRTNRHSVPITPEPTSQTEQLNAGRKGPNENNR